MTRSPSSKFCNRTTPNPEVLASVCTVNGRSKSGQAKIGAEISACLSLRKAASFSGPHFYFAFFLVMLVNDAAVVEKSRMKRQYHDANPMNWRICLMVAGVGHWAMALVFLGLVRILRRSITWPRYFSSFRQKWHFSGFSWRRASRNQRKTS